MRTSTRPRAPSSPPPRPTESRGRILVVDDERAILYVIGRMLRAYDVEVHLSPLAALARIEAGERYDVVLTDLMMDEMLGHELFFAVQARAPEQAERFVFVTAGAVRGDAATFLDTTARPVLRKPFKKEALLALVARILGQPVSRPPI